MALKNQVPRIYGSGINNVGSYQVAGRPWVKTYSGIASGSTQSISFPKVTKNILVINQAGVAVRVHFCAKATSANVFNNKHYIHLDSDEDSISMNIRVKELYITPEAGSAGFTVFAELTNIEPENMYSYNVAGIDGVSD